MEPLATAGPQGSSFQEARRANQTRSFQLFCEKCLNSAESEVRRGWVKDPEAIVLKGVRITGKPRTTIIEALKGFFHFEGEDPSPSVGFYHLLSITFPVQEIANNKTFGMSLKKFIESQKFFRKIAIAFVDFRRAHPKKTPNDWIEWVQTQQFFAQSGLNNPYKEWFYNHLRLLDSDIPKVLFDNEIIKIITNRMYTMVNAAIGARDPQDIIPSLEKLTGPMSAEDKESITKEIPIYANLFFLDSIRLHIQQLQKEEPLSKGEFIEGVTACVEHFLPIIKALTCLLLPNPHIKSEREAVLTKFRLNDTYNTSPIACTLLNAFLRYFKYDSEIYFKLNAHSKITESFAHRIILVTHPITGEKVLVDPTHKQFLKDLYSDINMEWQSSDIWVCPLDQINTQLNKHLIYRQRRLKRSTANSNTTILNIPEKEFILFFQQFYDISSYERTIRNHVAEGILVKDPDPNFILDGYSEIQRWIGEFGLQDALACKGYKEVAAELKKESSKLSIVSLLERLIPLPDHYLSDYIKLLGLDSDLIDSRLLSRRTVGYAMALRQVVNPVHNPNLTVLYGCSGPDLTLPFLATNPGHLYLVDKTPLDPEKIKNGLLNLKQLFAKPEVISYITWKHSIGAAKASGCMVSIEDKFVVELVALGMENSFRMRENSEFNGYSFSFDYKYNGQPVRNYHFTYIVANLEDPKTYPVGLKRLITEQAIDIYYQKAAYEIPRVYSKFLPYIASGIKIGGFMMTADYDWTGTNYPSDPHLSSPKYQFSSPMDTPLLNAYRQLFTLYLPSSWIAAPTKIDVGTLHTREDYWLFTDIRKKLALTY